MKSLDILLAPLLGLGELSVTFESWPLKTLLACCHTAGCTSPRRLASLSSLDGTGFYHGGLIQGLFDSPMGCDRDIS